MVNSSFNLSDLNGINGFAITAATSEDDNLGASVSALGDINNDGFDDVLIEAPGEFASFNSPLIPTSYLLFGGASVGSSGSFNVSNLDGSNGFAIRGIANTYSSLPRRSAVSGAGDINNDGFDDLIVGAPTAFPMGRRFAGQSYVIFGSANVGSGGRLNPTFISRPKGFSINGIARGDGLGVSVSTAGDINNDGFDDLIIGASGADANGFFEAGTSYVVFGSPTVGSAGRFNLLTLDGRNGFAINGVAERDSSGFFVSTVGDINNDGFDDLMIGGANTTTFTRPIYIVFGSTTVGSDGILNLSELNGSNGFAINYPDLNVTPAFGINNSASGSALGDINNDGIDDLIIDGPGESFVVFGNADLGSGGTFNLSNLDGTNGFRVPGNFVNVAGDINNDGINDLGIGLPSASPNDIFFGGQSYVVFGNSTIGSEGTIDFSSLDGVAGFAINGSTQLGISGWSLSRAGDFNNDGIDDLIIGAPSNFVPAFNTSGRSYIIYGNAAPTLDLNGADSGIDFTTTYNGTRVAIVDPVNLTIGDINNRTLSSATITITNLLDGDAESLSANTENTNINGNYDELTGILTLTGSDTIANYQEVLRSVTYNNTNLAPNTTERIIEFVVDDGLAHTNVSSVATTTLNFNINTLFREGIPTTALVNLFEVSIETTAL